MNDVIGDERPLIQSAVTRAMFDAASQKAEKQRRENEELNASKRKVLQAVNAHQHNVTIATQALVEIASGHAAPQERARLALQSLVLA